MFLLKAQLEFFGLTAPAFSWIVSIALILYSARVYGTYLRVSRNRQQVLAVAEKRLLPLPRVASRPSMGLSHRAYRMICSVFDDLPLLSGFWQVISTNIVVKTGEKGEERIWVSEPASIDPAELMDLHSYRTAPTVISGIGLLATFLAILVALLDVRLASNRVQGLDLLVQGLSGKFLSSVVAVACATLLIFLERGSYRAVRKASASLEKTLRGILPRLSPTQVMADLHAEIREQSKLIGNIGIEVATRFKNELAEGMGPTVEQLSATMSSLAASAEAENGGPAEKRLALLFEDFGKRLESTVHGLADRFANSPAGNALQDFSRIADSLSTTVAELQTLNNRLSATQITFNDFVDRSKSSTAEEVAGRQSQIEQLTSVVSDLMVKLHEKTEESTGAIQHALTSITFDMSNKVIELSKQMGEVLERSSERSADRTKEVLEQAGSLSSRSAEQLALLLERHSSELTRVEELRAMLDGTIKTFSGSMGRYGEVTDGLITLTSRVNAGIAALGQVSRSINDSQQAAVQVSLSLSGQIDSMKGFAEKQREVWERINGSMTEYEQVFASVEGHAGELLSQVAHHLGGYSDATQKHFVELTSAADNFISRATGRLSSSIDELSEQLDELQGALSGIGTLRAAV